MVITLTIRFIPVLYDTVFIMLNCFKRKSKKKNNRKKNKNKKEKAP